MHCLVSQVFQSIQRDMIKIALVSESLAYQCLDQDMSSSRLNLGTAMWRTNVEQPPALCPPSRTFHGTWKTLRKDIHRCHDCIGLFLRIRAPAIGYRSLGASLPILNPQFSILNSQSSILNSQFSFFTSHECSGFVSRSHCYGLFFVHSPASSFVTSLRKFISRSSLRTNPPEQGRRRHAPPGAIHEAHHRERPKLAIV